VTLPRTAALQHGCFAKMHNGSHVDKDVSPQQRLDAILEGTILDVNHFGVELGSIFCANSVPDVARMTAWMHPIDLFRALLTPRTFFAAKLHSIFSACAVWSHARRLAMKRQRRTTLELRRSALGSRRYSPRRWPTRPLRRTWPLQRTAHIH